MRLSNLILKMKQLPFTLFIASELGVNLNQLAPHFDQLQTDQYLQRILKLSDNKVMRQRSMISYQIEMSKQGHLLKFHEYYQKDHHQLGDQIHHARIYEQMKKELKDDETYKNFVYNSMMLGWQMLRFNKATLNCHAIRTISYHDQKAQPSPEGLIQHKADLEIMAVVNKVNCQGAQTQLFTPHKSNTLFDMSLDQNEGLILKDPDIWTYQQEHTPVKEKFKGIRDTLGILLKVEE